MEARVWVVMVAASQDSQVRVEFNEGLMLTVRVRLCRANASLELVGHWGGDPSNCGSLFWWVVDNMVPFWIPADILAVCSRVEAQQGAMILTIYHTYPYDRPGTHFPRCP